MTGAAPVPLDTHHEMIMTKCETLRPIAAVKSCLMAAIFGLVVLFMYSAAAAADHAVLAMPGSWITGLAAFVAEDEQLWRGQGLDVSIAYIPGVGAINAVIAGSADFTFSSGVTFNRAAARGQRLLAIASTLNRPTVEVVVRTDIAAAGHFDPTAPLALRAQVLRGRTISVDSINSLVHSYLRVIAHAGGFDPDEIRVTPMQPADMLAAMRRNAIDGFVAGAPWPQQLEDEGAAVAVASGVKGDPADLTPIAFSLVVTRPQYCAEHGPICMKMGHAVVLADQFIRDHPVETLALIKKRYNGVSEAVLAHALDMVRAGTPARPVVEVEALRNADRLNVEAGLMQPAEQLTSYEGLYTDAFIR